PDVRADVRRPSDGCARAGRGIPLRVLGKLPPVLGGGLLRPRRRARISLRSCRSDPVGGRPPASSPGRAARRPGSAALDARARAVPLERIRRPLVDAVWPPGEPGFRPGHRARVHGDLLAVVGTGLRIALLALARPLLLGAMDGARAARSALAAPLRPGSG